MEILLDLTSIEIFANGGGASLSKALLPKNTELSVKCMGDSAKIESLKIIEVKSAWTAATAPTK